MFLVLGIYYVIIGYFIKNIYVGYMASFINIILFISPA